MLKDLLVMLFSSFITFIMVAYIFEYHLLYESVFKNRVSYLFDQNQEPDTILNNDTFYTQYLTETIKIDNIKQHLKILTTNFTTLAGTQGDFDSAEYVHNFWKNENFDYVNKFDYDVLLSYPNDSKPNNIVIRNSNGIQELIEIVEPVYEKELKHLNVVKPFLAFSKNGSITTNKVYYGNYCTLDDFKYLSKVKGLHLNDSIVICRYGVIFRSNKIMLASENGAKAVLLYDDPIRSVPIKSQIYPNGEFLPEDGVQRGTIYVGNGDPLTPSYPSTDGAYRIKESEIKLVPNIMAQVIGYKYVKRIFELISEYDRVDSNWTGGLDVPYTYGGLLKNNVTLTLNIYNYQKIAKTFNVMGIIKGTTEPDRNIIFGNHRDAWTFGSIDPLSGTASMLEISRVLNSMKKSKIWVPRRSIIFMSWGAEEYGLIGSTEWIEEFNKKLSANTIAYLNVDLSVQGNFSYIGVATPLLFDLLYDVTKSVKIDENETVFDRWRLFQPNKDNTRPRISTELGSGSDHSGFAHTIGIACIDSYFTHNSNDPKYKLIPDSYALYHTSYETYDLIEKYIDPGFKSFKTISIVVGELARRLSDSVILPFNCISYANELQTMFDEFSDRYGQVLNDNSIDLNYLSNAIRNFTIVAKIFHKKLNKIDRDNLYLVRQYNDQMKDLEKAFIDFHGINRDGYLHMITAPSIFNGYGSQHFPALTDAIYNAIEVNNNWDEVKRQLSIVVYVVRSAISILNDPNDFERYVF